MFGINRIKPFDENFTREQMKSWKTSSNAKKVHEDLYTSVNSNDEHDSENYLSLIFKHAFISKEEQTRKNAVWTQAVLEIIFDESYLSPKIESDYIDKWYAKLIKVMYHCFCLSLSLSFIITTNVFNYYRIMTKLTSIQETTIN
jgi:hypothetical protein